jgi:hypothetical protein
VDHPLVYHVFGHLENRRTLVLTEDNIFDYLLWVKAAAVTANQGTEPQEVRDNDRNPSQLRHVRAWVSARLAHRSLLFLGLPADDWTFRVLLRTIIDPETIALREKKPQLAVQLDPDDTEIKDKAAARGYLAKYLGEKGIVDVFWCGVEEFVQELHRAWRSGSQPAEAAS